MKQHMPSQVPHREYPLHSTCPPMQSSGMLFRCVAVGFVVSFHNPHTHYTIYWFMNGHRCFIPQSTYALHHLLVYERAPLFLAVWVNIFIMQWQ